MNKLTIRKLSTVTCFGLIALSGTVASKAKAQCVASMAQKPGIVQRAQPVAMPKIMRTASPEHSRLSSEAPRLTQNPPTVVGLWNATFTSGGVVGDQGFDIWHADGTEVLNDTPPPATGNVCLGTWVQTGTMTYKLVHLSWSFDENGNLNGTVIIRETVTLADSGASYTGPFTVDAFDLAGNPTFHLDGQVTAERVTVASF